MLLLLRFIIPVIISLLAYSILEDLGVVNYIKQEIYDLEMDTIQNPNSRLSIGDDISL